MHVFRAIIFFFNDPATTETYTLSLHDALPISFTYDASATTNFETIQGTNTAIDTFSYTVTDNHGHTSTATVTVDVSETDAAPTAATFTASADEDASITGSLTSHVTADIGRAHVWTPVTLESRIPSSTCKKNHDGTFT